MITPEDIFVLAEVKAMGYAIGVVRDIGGGRWVVSAVSPTGVTVMGMGGTRSKAVWALRAAVVQSASRIEP